MACKVYQQGENQERSETSFRSTRNTTVHAVARLIEFDTQWRRVTLIITMPSTIPWGPFPNIVTRKRQISLQYW